MNYSVEYGLGFNSNINTTFGLRLFVGAIYNSYQVNVYVQIYDNDGAFTVFNIPESLMIYPNETNLEIIMNNLISEDPSLQTNIILNEGSLVASIQEIQRISSLLNYQSLSDKLGLILTEDAPIFPQSYGPQSNYSGVIQVI